MAWFFEPKCSVEGETKKWLENCFQWLIREFGEETVKETLVVLPNKDFFPDRFSMAREDIQVLFETVCEYMETNSHIFELYFYENEIDKLTFNLPFFEGSHKGAAGFYRENDDKYVIGLQIGKSINHENLVAAMAHEIAHGRLLGEKRIAFDNKNHEYLADLLPVIFGMGIFSANSAFNFEQFTNSRTQGWRASRQGYLNEEMFGYALAMFAYTREEDSPDWAKFLKVNIKHYFSNSLKYLLKTNDTKIKRF